ncbi:AbrB/MazE/SpoVT family DNA-binding domain-containing protein [Microbacterium sp.]|uniref:AbrB/MazE/SpoVT family DNA-binding domain-containing protein n=1 Tax=Microbacterium sp. TaxID=51671 RepID=UPI0039E41CF4
MKLNSKGQVTIPAELRRSHGFGEGDEVEVVARMRGRATSTMSSMSTDEIMALLRDR